MFGYHDIPMSFINEDISISVDKEGENLIYKRKISDDKNEKILLVDSAKILINPIEPLHKPKELTPYLLIELEKSVVVEPRATKKIYLKFPIEIGIFVYGQNEYKLLDILTLVKQKLTLYGEVRGGFICKHWRSDVYSSIPATNQIKDGVIELTITNTTPRWHEITKIVLNAYGMKIYYNQNNVSMRTRMRIYSGGIGETEVFDSPLYKDMQKALELYTARRLKVVATKFLMEWGL